MDNPHAWRTTIVVALQGHQYDQALLALYCLMCDARDRLAVLHTLGAPASPLVTAWCEALLLDRSWPDITALKDAYCQLWSPDDPPRCSDQTLVAGITYELRRYLTPLRTILQTPWIDNVHVSLTEWHDLGRLVDDLIALWTTVRDLIRETPPQA